ncbi:hypothetical protein NCPPB3923_11390 [Burkholderia glumae]|nr:hypothetical protein NCPPB3923_11390 [Burkholderia glumae]
MVHVLEHEIRNVSAIYGFDDNCDFGLRCEGCGSSQIFPQGLLGMFSRHAGRNLAREDVQDFATRTVSVVDGLS